MEKASLYISMRKTYILAIKDEYRVRAENEEKAMVKLGRNIGEPPFEIYNIEVVDVEE